MEHSLSVLDDAHSKKKQTRELLDGVDTHSKIGNERHAFEAGIKAQPGIEW